MGFNPWAVHIRDKVYQDTVVEVKRVDLRNAWPQDSDDKVIYKRDVRISYRMSLTIERDLEEVGIGIAFRFEDLGKQGQKFFVLYDQRSLSHRDSLPHQAKPFLDRLEKDPGLHRELGIEGLRAKLRALNNFVKEFGA